MLAARSHMSKIAVACRTLEQMAAEPPARSSGWLPFRHVTRRAPTALRCRAQRHLLQLTTSTNCRRHRAGT